MLRQKRKKTRPARPETSEKQLSPEREQAFTARVRNLIESLCETEGLELVHVEHQRERGGRKLRLYIDKPGGVTLDDCVYVSRQSGDLLDVCTDSMGPYNLEVSSPGPDRPLGKTADFERFKGKTAHIRTIQPVDGRKNFKGVLLGLSEEIVMLLVDDKTIFIPLDEISRARLVDYRPDFDAEDLTGR